DAVAHGLGLNLLGHLAGVSRLAFSRDGRLLVSSGDDCALTVWDLERGEGRRLLGHGDEVWRVAFDPEDRRLASTSRDGTIALWNPRSGERLALFKAHAASARMVAFTRDGRLISGGDDNRLLLWDLDHERAELVDECLSGTFFTDGARVGCVSTDRAELRVFDLDSGARHVLRGGAGELLEPPGAFAPEGTDELVIGTRGGAVLRWRWPKNQVMRLRASGGENQIRVTRYTPDGRFIAGAGADRKVWVWERESGAQRWEFLGHTGRVTRLDVSPDARRLASIGGENGARLWDLDSGDGLLLTGLQRVATTVRFAPDGRSLAAASTDGEVRIWRGASLSDNPGARIPLPQALAVDPLRPRLATSDAAGDLTFWDLDSGAPQATIATGRPLAHLTFVADGGAMIGLDATGGFVEFSPEGAVVRSHAGVGARAYSLLEASQDGRHVITTSTEDGALLHWDRESDTVAELVGHRDYVRDRAFSPDSRWLVSGGPDRELRLWDLDARTSEVIDRHSLPLTAVAFSTDGRYVLSAGDSHEIRVFDRIQGTVTADPLSGFYVRALVPFADGERVAVLNGDSAILIWDLRQRRVVHRLFGHQAPVRNVTLADDGATLLSQAEDNEIRLWDVASGESRVLGALDDWLAALVWHPSRRVVAYTIRNQVGIWSDDVPRDRTSFLAWLADTRDNLTRRAADLEPVPGCPHGHPSDE
ncbi:MAG: WD40 repeat domain-containing protein, partial [Myxococcales bacterium]|nr:WD40 repeat domain-containing protein [Myxococcales bacterium]